MADTFWQDLNDDLADEEFRDEYERSTAYIEAVDRSVRGDGED